MNSARTDLCSAVPLQAGPYVVKLMDTFGGLCVMMIAVFELIGIMWVYGVRRFCDNVEFMVGYKPTMFFKVCWVVVAPLLLVVSDCEDTTCHAVTGSWPNSLIFDHVSLKKHIVVGRSYLRLHGEYTP